MTARLPSAAPCVPAILLLAAIAGPVPAGQPAPAAQEGAGSDRPGAGPANRGTAHLGLLPGSAFRDCDICPEMVVVPAGSFTMGSPPDEKRRMRRDNQAETSASIRMRRGKAAARNGGRA